MRIHFYTLNTEKTREYYEHDRHRNSSIGLLGIVELVNGPRAKKKDKKETQVSDQTAQKIAALKERIETLEKIITDEKYDLNRQFDDLKKDKVA